MNIFKQLFESKEAKTVRLAEKEKARRIEEEQKVKQLAEEAKAKEKLNEEGELYNAAESGDIQKIKSLIEKGVDVDTKASRGKPPLSIAAKEGQYDAVALLLKNGANVNGLMNEEGDTPLYSVAVWLISDLGDKNKLQKVMKLLVDNGAKVGPVIRRLKAKSEEWKREHDNTLSQFLAKGLVYSEIKGLLKLDQEEGRQKIISMLESLRGY